MGVNDAWLARHSAPCGSVDLTQLSVTAWLKLLTGETVTE